MNDSDLELERLKFGYEEKLAWQELKNRIAKKLLEEKISESNLQNQRKMIDLEEIEEATLNILEDSKELEERLSAIIFSMNEGLLVIDKNNYEVVFMNPAAEKIWGVSSNEIIGKNINKVAVILKGDEIISEEERPVARMFQTGRVITVGLEDNFYCQDISGRKFPVEMTASPIKGDGITGAVVVFRDVSEFKALDEARISFISIASHQLRTPLTSIRWYAEMLESGDAGPLNENQKDFIGQVHHGALKLNEIIDLLLVLAKVEAGRTEQERVKINLVSFTQDVLKALEPQIKQKNLRVELISSDKPLPEMEFDASMLRQIVTNLLSNSIRYTDDKGRIEIRIAEREERKGEREIIYSVKDDGIGIPENAKEKIFNKFFRADNATSKVPDGSGLGLSLVKSLAELNKSKVWFESPAPWGSENKGTVFYFTIPID